MISRIFDFLSRRIDGPLMAALALTIALGIIVVYSASGGSSLERAVGQGRNLAVAIVALWIFAHIHPQLLMRLALPVYVVGLGLLIGVALFGEIRNGARRWLSLGFTTVQPSEVMKIAVPLVLAWYFHRREEGLRMRDFALAAFLLVLPMVFAGAASLPFLWSMLHDYQRQRVLTLLNPMEDPLGAGYHIIQSTIAIGSGGILGKGWLNGTQAQLDFVPERSTDFILAVFGEEFGLVGNVLLIALYVLIIGRGFMIAASASTVFSRLAAGAITLTFFTYAFVNMGMVSGILPVVGVPLPLISYGGTALLSMLVAFGILMSISTHKQLVSS
jgi:rod shape determining protein RodA